MPTIAEKYVAGYIFNADGTPEVGSTVSATISERIIRTGSDNLVLENDETVTGVTDGTGRFVLSLHPNNRRVTRKPSSSPTTTHRAIRTRRRLRTRRSSPPSPTTQTRGSRRPSKLEWSGSKRR
jgi:hypothetical protein